MESSGTKDGLNKAPILQRLPMSRPHGSGTKGNQIRLRTNHFKVSVHRTDVIFYHYNVSVKYEDDKPVESKGVSRTVIEKLQEIYLANVDFVYDGENNLYTMCALQNVEDAFMVVVEDGSSTKSARSRTPGGNGSPEGSDTKRMKRPMTCKTYKVELKSVGEFCKEKKSVGEIPLSAIDKVLRGQESDDCQEALRVLDIILRQKSAKQGCLLVRQSFFHSPSEPIKLGGGVVRCPGYHSSFRPTQSGLSLNIDVSTTMIVEPGPVINFILSNQYIKDPSRIDWGKAKHALRNLRIKTTHTNSEFKISSLSEKSCYEQKFLLKQRNGNGPDVVEITVYDYYLKHWDIRLQDSAIFPCLVVGKPKRPTYLPIELCHLVSLQRYTKALTVLQRSSLVQSSRKNPRERKSDLSSALQRINYNSDDILKKCGISIAPEFAQVDGRILQAPKLKAGDGQDLIARDGRWNFMNRKLFEAKGVHTWAAVNFTTRWKLQDLVRRLIHCGDNKGINISPPQSIFEERLQGNESAASRVDAMLEQIRKKIEKPPTFLLCVLPDKNSDIYETSIPIVSRVPTIIFGMDVSHGAPRSNVPSIAAVVSSLGWPCISRYRASVCTLSPRVEIIDSLFKPQGNEDRGLISELLFDFYLSSGKQRPEQVIIFRFVTI
ncbi:hypothetical protein BDA96_03G135400 [Sorghum bicolor]|uniref:PAZ domain-containing protein n=1 Tax=Sorghum bicolor TaxID=4558 RepID=A0A921UN59_SORBI|nr:hypothetical protein BDA96_03G135400 [Sorghum bicolor]